MKRPLFNIAVFLVLGEFLASWSGKMAFIWMAGICVPAVFFYYFYNKEKKGYGKFAGGLLLLAGMLGCFLYLKADEKDALFIYCEQTEQPPFVWVNGTIEQIEERDYDTRLYLKNAEIFFADCSWKQQGVIVSTKNQGLKIGNQVQVWGELNLFQKATNPGEFDLRSYYCSKGYRYRLACKEWILLDKRYSLVREWLRELRRKMGENIDELADERDAGIFRAVFLGEADKADETIKELYERQGIAHLLSVSGLHISIIGMVVYRILQRLMGSFGISGFLGGVFVILYGMLSGGSLSTNRSVIMYLFSLLAAWRGRIYDMQTSLGAAAIVMTAGNPLIIEQSSFQLSFSAVLGLSAIADAWKAFLLREEKQGMLSVLSLQQMMLPALLFSFYQQPVFSMLINQLILPFGELLIACAAGCACLGGALSPVGNFFAVTGHGVLYYYETICRIFNEIPGGILVNGRPAVWRIFVCLIFLTVLMVGASVYRERKKCILSAETVPPNWKKRSFIVQVCAGITVFFFSCFLKADPIRLPEVTMLDVGQGDCFLIRFPGGVDILSDCGSSSETELAEYTLEPVLLSKGISSLDAMILSHADEDHVNGAIELLKRQNIEIERLILPAYQGCQDDFSKVLEVAACAGCPYILWRAEMALKVGEAELVCLHPFSDREYTDTNAASLVYRLSYGDFDMLFTGDIGEREEAELVTEEIDVLKVAHHGSRYSSSEQWLNQLGLQVALISCGKDNRYGHPHEETIKRIQKLNADCYLTSELGAVTVIFDTKTFQIETEQEK